MQRFVCDVCGKTVRQAIRIDADLESIGSNVDTWSDGDIAGDYCQDCADKIILFVCDLKGEGDSLNAMCARARRHGES